jgi:hypothetical protein
MSEDIEEHRGLTENERRQSKAAAYLSRVAHQTECMREALDLLPHGRAVKRHRAKWKRAVWKLAISGMDANGIELVYLELIEGIIRQPVADAANQSADLSLALTLLRNLQGKARDKAIFDVCLDHAWSVFDWSGRDRIEQSDAPAAAAELAKGIREHWPEAQKRWDIGADHFGKPEAQR